MPSSKPVKEKAPAARKQSKPVATVATAAAVAPQSATDVHEQIRRRAYELYQQRKGQNGSPEQDWLRAENEVLTRGTQRSA